MPLPVRVISPNHVSRNKLSKHKVLTDELEAMDYGYIITQMSSLSKNANEAGWRLCNKRNNFKGTK